MTSPHQKLLLIEPDSPDRVARATALEREFEVTVVADTDAALRMLRAGEWFSVVASSQKVSGDLDGVALLKEVHALDPHVGRMLLAEPTARMSVLELDALHRVTILSLDADPEDVARAAMEAGELHRALDTEVTLRRDLVEERAKVIRQLHEFMARLNPLVSLQDIADLVVNTAATMLDSGRVSLMLPDSSGQFLTIAASVGLEGDVVQGTEVPLGAPIAGRVFTTGESLILNDPGELPETVVPFHGDAANAVPMVSACLVATGGEPVGVLNVTQPLGGAPYDDVALANAQAIAEAAAIAIQNQNRRRERDDARDSVILAMAKLAEYRDPETGSHLQRLQAYCRLLATALAHREEYQQIIDEGFVEDLVRSAPLHDIGKVGIPDQILKKPGRHTPEEMETMRRHTTIGGDTLRSLREQGQSHRFLKMGMEVAYYHHEKWDGSGYPFGMSGREIPLCARILALADVYDALTTRRVYKEPFPHAQAREFIENRSSSHFDPNVVEAFLASEEEFVRVAAEFADEPDVDSRATAADVEFPEQERTLLD